MGSGDLITIIFFIAVAAVIIIKLNSVLGLNSEDDEERTAQKKRDLQKLQEGNVISLPSASRDQKTEREHAEDLSKLDVDSLTAFKEIVKRDQGFTLEFFITGAKGAFEMILSAFAEGNKVMLKDLLDDEIYKGFERDVDERKSRGEKLDITLVSIASATISKVRLESKDAFITVNYVTEQIRVLKNPDGVVISGSAQTIERATDTWIFTRNLRSTNPNWKLCETA